MRPPPSQVILVTGAAGGLGAAVAAALADAGVTMLVHGRSPARAEEAAAALRARGGVARAYHADLASLAEVGRMADAVLAAEPRLDALVNNAGVGTAAPGGGERVESEDGHELRFAVNYLAGYLLTHRVIGLLERSAPARIVTVASAGQGPIDFDDVMLDRGYSGARAYAQSKLAQVMLTLDLAEELRDRGVTATCLHPATYMPTGMVRDAGVRPVQPRGGRRGHGAARRGPRAGRGDRPLLRGRARGGPGSPGAGPAGAAAAAGAEREAHRGPRPGGIRAQAPASRLEVRGHVSR